MALDSTASNATSSYETLGDNGATMAMFNRILADNKVAKTAAKKCYLLSMPPELRTRIWEYILQGDGGVIHVDHQDVWGSIEMEDRLNFTLTCTQIREETRTMFLPNNTFLFQARDKRINFGILENLADWLNWVTDEDLPLIGRIVVCSKMPIGRIQYAWTQVQYMNMDVGFVVGERLDKPVGDRYQNKYGLYVYDYESWGLEDGHHCNKCHYEIVLPKPKTKGKGKGKEKASAEDD